MKILSRRAEMRKMRQSTEPVRAPSAEEGRPGGSWSESMFFSDWEYCQSLLNKSPCAYWVKAIVNWG